MKSAGRRILSIGCVILLLPGLICSCKKRNTGNTSDASSAAEQKIRTLVDDLFAYIKIARTDKISSFFEDENEVENSLSEVKEKAGTKAFEAACRRVDAEIKTVAFQGEEGLVHLDISCASDLWVTGKASETDGFEDQNKLSEAVSSAPSITKEIMLVLYQDETSWKITSDCGKELLDELFGFLKDSGLIAEPKDTTKEPVSLNISVFDAYWVDPKGKETGGYHCSEEKICLYIYTWNTYSNVEIRYDYEDSAGNLLYSNTFLMKSNTDWIACSWRPAQALPEGEIYCRVYEPNGDEFHTSKVGIYKDDAMLPFPITWISGSSWLGDVGEFVSDYPEEAAALRYRGRAMKTYKDLSLTYRFLDEQGEVLYEGTMEITESTDVFEFVYIPEEPLTGGSVITLEVLTKEGNPFLTQEVTIRMPEPEITGTEESDASSSPSKSS